MKYLNFFLICICIISFSCNNEFKKNSAFENLLVDFPNSTSKYEAYILIPRIGCQTCPSVTENFLKRSINRYENIRFVLSHVNSFEELNKKLDLEILDHPNIVIDKYGKYCLPENIKESIYPVILYLKGNTIKKIEFLCEKNPYAFTTLEKKINK